MDSEPFDSLTFELAVYEAKLYSVILPPHHVPLPWVRELTSIHQPKIAAEPKAVELLIRTLFNHGLLLETPTPDIAQLNSVQALQFRDSAIEEHIVAATNRLHSLCEEKLERDRTESQKLINRVMTGDPNQAVTAWTVPSLVDVQQRAANVPNVEIIDFADGTFSVRTNLILPWEKDCLKQFAQQEFASNQLASIAWALRTGLLPTTTLREAAPRVGQLHLHQPESTHAILVAGLYWLSLAHANYRDGGSCRTSWSNADQAVEILRPIRASEPNDPIVAALFAEAEEARWKYDD